MPLEPTTATIRHLADRYGLTVGERAGLTPVARGAMGQIWRLDTGTGRVFAVKELFWGGDEAAVRADVAFQNAATGADTAFRDPAPGSDARPDGDRGRIEAPASHRTLDGRYLCALPGGAGPVRLFDWADGRPLGRPDRESTAWFGRTLGILHALGWPAGNEPPDPWYWRGPATGDWRRLVDHGAAWAEPLRAALPRLTDLAARIRPDNGPQWICCHLDLKPSNVLVRDSVDGSTGRRFTLLDWENAGPGTPERELAAGLLTWYIDDASVAATVREYRRAGGPVEWLSPDAFSLAIATLLNYLHLQAGMARSPRLDPDERRHAEQECARALAALPTPERLARVRATANSSLAAIEA